MGCWDGVGGIWLGASSSLSSLFQMEILTVACGEEGQTKVLHPTFYRKGPGCALQDHTISQILMLWVPQ